MRDATSDWIKMERGYPQGSPFDPLLWNIYQNDMSAHVKDANLTIYANCRSKEGTMKQYSMASKHCRGIQITFY